MKNKETKTNRSVKRAVLLFNLPVTYQDKT
nr:MAG TPA_asm: hypothetical protein [Caudoviricetes sp.]DAO69478.1 MAG TPA: hypothetical protein [Caudoviricetes sp.]